MKLDGFEISFFFFLKGIFSEIIFKVISNIMLFTISQKQIYIFHYYFQLHYNFENKENHTYFSCSKKTVLKKLSESRSLYVFPSLPTFSFTSTRTYLPHRLTAYLILFPLTYLSALSPNLLGTPVGIHEQDEDPETLLSPS